MTGWRGGRPLRRCRYLAVAAVLAIASAAALPGGAAAQGPPEWRLETLDGRSVTLSQLGGRPMLVNVWATWCAPCVAELRSIERLAAALEGADVAIVLVSPEERRVVAEWVRRRGYALPFYVEGTRIPRELGLEAVPTTWILDREGRVVVKRRGAFEWDRPEAVALLRRLAAVSPAARP